MTPKITLSILVEDESGILTRITNLFNRRGFYLESLTVGPSEIAGTIRIVLILQGDSSTCKQLTKQLYKMVNVIHIQNFTSAASIQRELLLVKFSMKKNPRLQIDQIIQAFKAKIVDISESFLTLEITGEPNKILAARRLMSSFDIIEVATTGRACLFREL